MSSEATPQTKAGRHAAIRNLLVSQTISSQEQLRSALGTLGIEVTQATLSRDLMEMRATKMRDRSGTLIYSVTQTVLNRTKLRPALSACSGGCKPFL